MPAVNRYYSSVAIDTTLKFSISSSDLTLVVDSTAGFPTSYPYTLAIGYDSSNEELVTIVGASGTTLTVGTTVAGGANIAGRGIDGTNDQAHIAGEAVKHVISARDMTEAQAHIAAETGIHGLGVGISPAPLASPTFTGTVVLPSTTSIGSVSSTEIGYLDGVTSAVQTQLNAKAPSADPTFTGTVVLPSTTSIGSVSATELGYVDGVTSSIQTQFANQTSALAAHEADTTSIHGIADTSKLARIASASAGRTMFVQAAEPTALAVGDIWFQVTGL